MKNSLIMSESSRILVLYATQTFTAQEVAERIWRTTKCIGFRGPVQSMDSYPISKLIHEKFAIFVCATAGQGDEPDNMKKFWKFLLRKNLPTNSLSGLKFGVLGLGDSSYTKFNFVAKKLNKRLVQLGATPLLDIGLCDYQHDLGHDAVAIPWLKQYFTKLKLYFPSIHVEEIKNNFVPRWKVTLIKDTLNSDTIDDIYFSKSNDSDFIEPKLLEIESNIRTTDETHFQDVRLLTLKTIGDDILDYAPGDVFNIRPRNSKEDIDDLFSIFETHGLDIKPHHRLLVEEYHEGPEKAAVIGGFSGGANTQSSQDDEYRYAGVEDPKIMITTSREPSARLKMFVKELRLVFPNSQRMNRGGYEMSQLIHACRANEVTDFIVVHEHRGVPDSLVICHLPYGPTASFTLSGVVMRHDIPDIGPMSEQFPHLVFHNFKSQLGVRTMSILKYLFPVPKADSKRVITFANHDDYVCFRQHTYRKAGKEIELTEVGPRFQIKLYEIKLGTLDALDAADTEWALRPYMNTAAKRRFMSDDDGWHQEEYMPVPTFLRQPLSLYKIAEQYWDLKAYPTQYVFSLLALVSQDKLERDKCMELSSPEGQEDWLNYCRRPRRTILEVLHDFHKTASNLPIDILFELFSTIKPRSFSIASSKLPTDGQKLDILMAVVKYYTKLKKERLGLCSNWMKTLNACDKVYGWIKKGSLLFPKDVDIPLIMIGPGTGLAPFRSLIQERVTLGTASKHNIHLFFGCRYRNKDYHCREEFEKLVEDGKISIYCAFSRDQDEKIYVQHKIAQHRQALWKLITDRQAYIYISGNAKNMPDNVRDAFIEHVFGEGGNCVEEGTLAVKNLENSGRWQVEAW